MQTKILAVGVAALVLMVGCSDADGDGSHGTTVGTQSAAEQCDGVAVCFVVGGHDSTTTRMHREDGECYAGGLKLGADGRATAEGIDATWRTTSDGFDVCASDGCMRCVSPAASSARAARACKGVATSCYSRSVASCTWQDGCSVVQQVRIGWNNELKYEYDCDGTPEPCSSFDDADACASQSGCRWE